MTNIVEISNSYKNLNNNLNKLSNIIIRLEIEDELINKNCIFYCINLDNIKKNINNQRINGIDIGDDLYYYNAYNSTDFTLNEIKNINNINDIYMWI